jgi:hypothetical protein
MTLEPATYPRHRFPVEIISHAVWLYHVFSLSLRDAVTGQIVCYLNLTYRVLPILTDLRVAMLRLWPLSSLPRVGGSAS